MWLLRELRDAKARLWSSTYTVCVETTEKSPKPRENRTFKCFFLKISPLNLKMTFSICIPKLVDVQTVVFEKLDDGNWLKNLFLRNWSLCTVPTSNS